MINFESRLLEMFGMKQRGHPAQYRNTVETAAPIPKDTRYSRPFTSLFAYFSGVMNEPFANPT